jgi:uncharacterized protein with ATP-grasp and redox domains
MLPASPLPEPLRGEEAGSFAGHTVSVRLPGLVRLVLEENPFPPPAAAALEALIEEIPSGLLRELRDREAPDTAHWDRYLAPHLGKNWLQVPWYFAEAYFFRRILEATGYFRAGPGAGLDPYLYEKQAGLETSRAAIAALAERAAQWTGEGQALETLASLLHADLWGNQADLSMWPVGEAERPSHASARLAQEHLLIDDTQAVLDALISACKPPVMDPQAPIPGPSPVRCSSERGKRASPAASPPDPPASSPGAVTGSSQGTGPLRIDFLVDNAGFELACDLCLADALLRLGERTPTVHLHLKGHPIYISDATLPDVQRTLVFLQQEPSPASHSLGVRLEQALTQGRLRLKPDFFWCSPLPAWEMPGGLYEDLAQSGLVISKGDAHYRRLVGDRHWPYPTPFELVVSYFPAPLLALRTFKSQLAVGLLPGQAEDTARQDPGWMTGGRWGIIQFRDR